MSAKIDCAFCGNDATTAEHVIPKWLQRHYVLWNKQFRVWTGEAINYRCATIPACQPCNGLLLASLEKRIRTGTASDRDYYLWALKIRYGLSIVDSRLYIDPRDHDKGFLLPPAMKSYKAEFILPALASLDNPKFKFEPDPFGSVFIFKQEGNNQQHFSFADVPPPCWAISISLPPNRILAVLLADRGVVKSYFQKHGIDHKLSDLAKPLDSTVTRQILFSLVRIQNLLKIPGGYIKNHDAIISESIPDFLPTRVPKLEWYDELCTHLGINTEFGKLIYENDLKVAGNEFVQWQN